MASRFCSSGLTLSKHPLTTAALCWKNGIKIEEDGTRTMAVYFAHDQDAGGLGFYGSVKSSARGDGREGLGRSMERKNKVGKGRK